LNAFKFDEDGFSARFSGRKMVRERCLSGMSSGKQEKSWNFLLLIMSEKQLFSKKSSKNGLHFLRTWGIIISVFGAHRVLPAGSAYAIGAGMNNTLLLFVPNETKTQTNNLK